MMKKSLVKSGLCNVFTTNFDKNHKHQEVVRKLIKKFNEYHPEQNNKLISVVDELVSNSIKYSDSGDSSGKITLKFCSNRIFGQIEETSNQNKFKSLKKHLNSHSSNLTDESKRGLNLFVSSFTDLFTIRYSNRKLYLNFTIFCQSHNT